LVAQNRLLALKLYFHSFLPAAGIHFSHHPLRSARV